MNTPFWFSLSALILSTLSLGWSIHIGLRDRSKLRTSSKVYSDDAGNKYLCIKAVNCGRRPIILTMIISHCKNGHWWGTYLRGNGVRLGENEPFSENIRHGDNYTFFIDKDGNEKEAFDFSFEDTQGCHYKVRNARNNLKKCG